MKTASVTLANWFARLFYGLAFDGTAKYVSLPAAVEAVLCGPKWSFEAWVSMASTAAGQYLLGPQGATHARVIYVPGGGGSLALGEEGVSGAEVSVPVAANVPTHVAFTYDGANLCGYKNGALVSGPTAYNFGGTYVGAASLSDSNAAYALNGTLDAVRVYARALAAAEVAQHFAGVFNNEQSLLGRWEFDENTGTTAYDLSGQGSNGTLSGSPGYVSFNPYPSRGSLWVQADLYTFTLPGGAVYRYTSADRDITIGGNTFSSLGPRIQRGKTKLTNDLSVDSIDVTIYAKPTDYLAGTTGWLEAAVAGSFDGATLLVQRFISDNWANTALGAVHQFFGLVGACSVDRGKIAMKVNSPLILLNKQMPRNLFQPSCLHTLFDSGCTLSKASFAVNCTVASGSTASSINTSTSAGASSYFDLGHITFTSGANAGLTRTVKSFTAGSPSVFSLVTAFPAAPAAGDAFTAYPGCNKLWSGDCLNKFNNQANYRGFDFIPQPETTL